MTLIAGVDEAGRGPLAGPVVAAAVIFAATPRIRGMKDSKLLTIPKREALCELIKKKSLCWAIGMATVKEIDEINIYHATLLAMKRAVENLVIPPNKILVDGNRCPQVAMEAEAIVDGDFLVPIISAASIIAKVTRDQIMQKLDKKYPEYGFAQHKGYATKAHLLALKRHGVTPVHRRSFRPVKEEIMELTYVD